METCILVSAPSFSLCIPNSLYRVLVSLDRFVSSALGRPCAVHDEEWVYAPPSCCGYLRIIAPALTWTCQSNATMSIG